MRCPHCGGQLYAPAAEKRMAEMNEMIDECIDRATEDSTTRTRDGDEVVTKECGLL